MSKEYVPNIRVISVDNERTGKASALLRHTLDAHGFKNFRLFNSFCLLEAGRCGVPAGQVAIEVDGVIIWKGAELTEDLAERFCAGLPGFIEIQKEHYGLS